MATVSGSCGRSFSFNEYVTQQQTSKILLTTTIEKSFESGAANFLLDDCNRYLLRATPSLLHSLSSCVDWGEGVNRVLRTTIIETDPVTVTFDTGADTHVWSMKDALLLFTEQQASSLTIVGVDNAPTRADLAGHLLIAVEAPDGSRYTLDLGPAHAMSLCPLNLVSVSLLIKVGAIVHFEKDDCYFQAHAGAVKIPFDQKNGLFQLDVERGGVPKDPQAAHSYSLHGQCFCHLWKSEALASTRPSPSEAHSRTDSRKRRRRRFQIERKIENCLYSL